MPSSWGDSWGEAWGDSWGGDVQPAPPAEGAGASGGGKRAGGRVGGVILQPAVTRPEDEWVAVGASQFAMRELARLPRPLFLPAPVPAPIRPRPSPLALPFAVDPRRIFAEAQRRHAVGVAARQAAERVTIAAEDQRRQVRERIRRGNRDALLALGFDRELVEAMP